MHTEIENQVIGRFFTALDNLINRKDIDNIESYFTAHNFDPSALTSLKSKESETAFHFDWLHPLIMHYGISALWLLTGLGEMFMPLYTPPKNSQNQLKVCKKPTTNS